MSKSKKNPDRFNAMVEKLIPHEEDCVAHVHAAYLLRKQHRAVVRLVKQQTILAGNVIDRGVLIAALAWRAK